MSTAAPSMTHFERRTDGSETYRERYRSIRMERTDGVMEMHFHTNGGPVWWNLLAHNEFEDAFLQVGRDRENDVVIITGTGEDFSGPLSYPSRCWILDRAVAPRIEDAPARPVEPNP